MEKTLKVILIGAGGRGRGYTDIMKRADGRFEVVAVAEPIDERRNYIKQKWNLPDSACFTDYKPLLEKPKFADVALICTMDRMHTEPALAAMEKKYDLLLEKPAASTPEECLKIKESAQRNGVKVLVCHVLRYTDFYTKIKETIDSGKIGTVMSVHAAECVGNTHQSHSFVRGNWGNSEKSSCMILQKCCHDMDILQWLIGRKCKNVQSFGSLTYFTRENAPEGSPDYCYQGCPAGDTCPYNAVKLYYEEKTNWFRRVAAKSPNPTDDDIMEAIKTTQFGKCVFKCDNNVVDHQVVNLEFDGGAVVSFNMCAFNEGGRSLKIMGTKGEITAYMDKKTFDLFDFETRTHTAVDITDRNLDQSIVGGHGGGDEGIIDALYRYECGLHTDSKLSEIGISVENHMIAFAAEKSRLTGKVVSPDEIMQSAR